MFTASDVYYIITTSSLRHRDVTKYVTYSINIKKLLFEYNEEEEKDEDEDEEEDKKDQ